MLLIRELMRVLTNAVAYVASSGRIWLLVAILVVALAAMLTTSVTVLGPIAVYPFM